MNPLRIFLLAALVLVVFGAGNAEAEDPPEIEWNNSFFTDIGYSSNTGAYSLQQTTDGNYIVAGIVGYAISDTLQMDAILIKIDSNGNEIWNRTFSSQNNNTFPESTAAMSVKQTNDGGYIITGCYNCSGNKGLLLIKTDGNGIEQWITRLNLTENGFEQGYDVMQTADNGFIVYGKRLVKFDSSGNEEWNQTFENIVGVDTRVEQASDGGYVIVDRTAFSNIFSDALVIKTDSNGIEEWNKTFGGSGYDAIFSIQSISDEGYILAGYTSSFRNNSSYNGWLIKIDLEGNEKWNKTFGGQFTDGFFSVTPDYSGHYIATGHTQSFANGNVSYSSEFDIWIVKVDDKGNEIWNQTFGGDYFDMSFSIQETYDTGFVIAGRCSSNQTWMTPNNFTTQKSNICVIKYKGLEGFPTASIEFIDPQYATYNSEISFKGSGSDAEDSIVAYSWRSSIDGHLSSKSEFKTNNLSLGHHVISFRVRDSDGIWSYEVNETLVINPNIRPEAVILSITPSYDVPPEFAHVLQMYPNATIVKESESIILSGSGIDTDGYIVAYEWDITGHSNLPRYHPISPDVNLKQNISIRFSSKSNSDHPTQISLRVQDNLGAWSDWKTIELFAKYNTPPSNLDISIDTEPTYTDNLCPTHNSICYPLGTRLFFTGSEALDSDGIITNYLLTSSIDGDLSSELPFSTQHLSLGNHVISYKAWDNNGDWSESTTSFWIYAPPVAFAGQNSTGTPGVPLQFSGAGTDEDGIVVLYEWDFDGDGIYEWSSTENGRELNIYNNEGTYTATLRITDNDGFTDTDTVEITISDKTEDNDKELNLEEDGRLPSISLLSVVATMSLLAILRRK